MIHTWLPPVLDKRISRIRLAQCSLILVREVEVIKAKYKGLYAIVAAIIFGFLSSEGRGKGCDEGCFAYALDAV